MRHLFLHLVPLFPLLFGAITWSGMLIERRKRIVRATVLEELAGGLFVVSLSIFFLLIWPWSFVGNRTRYAIHLGLTVVVAHTVIASMRAYRAGKLLPGRGGWIVSGFLILMTLACLLGVGHVFLAPFPDDQILIAFPLEGDWYVGQGGPSVLTNAHVPYKSQRYALDLVKVGPDGKSFKADGRQLQDYYSWGQPVRAPLSGIVIESVKTYPDNLPGLGDDRDSRGNHVLIRSAAGEIVLLAHLRMESVLVKEGELVQEGQLMAEVGNSGNTTAPHLHIDATRATQSGPVSLTMTFKDIGASLRSQRRGATLGRSKE